MPTFTGKTFSSFYKNLLGIDQSSNTGVDATARAIQDGAGNNTSVSISDDVLNVKPQNDNGTRTFAVQDSGSTPILQVDTVNGLVGIGVGQIPANTQFKTMGLYDFSTTAGYHNPLVANNMMFSDSGDDIIQDVSMFGNGANPATTLDISADGTPKVAVACYWYLQAGITLDDVRYVATADASVTLNFHLFSYNISGTTGDLSNGTVHANASASATNTTAKTGTFSLDEADIDINRVVIGFVENVTDTNDVTVSFQIKYHTR